MLTWYLANSKLQMGRALCSIVPKKLDRRFCLNGPSVPLNDIIRYLAGIFRLLPVATTFFFFLLVFSLCVCGCVCLRLNGALTF